MTRAFKTFLVWLLMAVLPLHAVAAGIGMSCMPQHQSMRHAASAPVAATAQHDAGEAHAHHGHHDDGAGAPAATSAADIADTAGGGHPADDGENHSSCSACSVFCIGAVAPPSDYAPLLPFDGSEAVVIAPAAFAAGFIPDGPQRPPRRPSA
ncbi:hypothetical protein [Massilia sp. ST3]|uniref:hypothetical protein n=1 Tax=Massilia sp. ST3 TaxID=2824903 RepID=UPI001B810634|nr:hypothetical protein [Massilia sp. ST3]MBQ5946084.1 hypothetical protein [Massilia sp. ST3]